MASFAETLLLSTIMGLSIFISLPIVLHKRTSDMANRLLLAAAIGILVFIMADVWGDAAMILFNQSLYGYGSSPYYDGIFTAALSRASSGSTTASTGRRPDSTRRRPRSSSPLG